MAPADISALRAKACDVMAALGDVLDALKIAEQTVLSPCDAFSDAVVTLQHIDEAAGTADTLAEHAHELALALDKAALALKARVSAIEKLEKLESAVHGAPFDEPLSTGGAS